MAKSRSVVLLLSFATRYCLFTYLANYSARTVCHTTIKPVSTRFNESSFRSRQAYTCTDLPRKECNNYYYEYHDIIS